MTEEEETLVALVEHGPLWDGHVPSKAGRDALIKRGLAVRVVVCGDDGWQAATYAGRDAYKAMFPGPDGPADRHDQRSKGESGDVPCDQQRSASPATSNLSSP